MWCWRPPKSSLIRTDTTRSSATIENDRTALMLCPSVLSAPTLMGHVYAYNAILQPPHKMRRVDVVLAASSGLIRRSSTATIENDDAMSFRTIRTDMMGHFYSLNAILQPPHTMRRVNVVLATTPNQASSGQRRACSTATIDNDRMVLMLCPSALSVITLMGMITL